MTTRTTARTTTTAELIGPYPPRATPVSTSVGNSVTPHHMSSKRKLPETDGDVDMINGTNPFNAGKKAKIDLTKQLASAPSNKRKLVGAEEQPGGLLIVRAPPSSSQPIQSSQGRTSSRPPSRPPSVQPQPTPGPSTSSNANPPTKKFRAEPQPLSRASSKPPQPSSSQPHTSSRARTPLLSTVEEDPVLDADIRAMEDEADQLRRSSRAPDTSGPVRRQGAQGIMFTPKRSAAAAAGKAKHGREGSVSEDQSMAVTPKARKKPVSSSAAAGKAVVTTVPLPQDDSPQMARNKVMRDAVMSAYLDAEQQQAGGATTNDGKVQQKHRRKSSMGGRGKRISNTFEVSGIITQPHNSVSESSFYKHIDPDLSEEERIRRLLIWCSSRAAAATSSSKSTSSSSSQTPSLPPLSDKAKQLLKSVQNNTIMMLAEGSIDLSVSKDKVAQNGGEKLKENSQNLTNRHWEVVYSGQIKRAQEEDEAWKRLTYSYETYAKKTQAENEKRKASSAKSQGKRKATPTLHDSDGLNVLDEELSDIPITSLPPSLLPAAQLAQSVLERHRTRIRNHNAGGVADDNESRQKARLDSLRYKLDHLHTLTSAARSTTSVITSLLDLRYSTLSGALAARANPPRVLPSFASTSAEGSGSAGASASMAGQVLSTYLHPATTRGETPVVDGRDVLRALSRVDKERPAGMVGDAAWRAAREVQRAGVSGVGVVGERRLTGVGVVSASSSQEKLQQTPRKGVLGTPRRGTTPGRERERGG